MQELNDIDENIKFTQQDTKVLKRNMKMLENISI